MVDIQSKLEAIKELVDSGAYFTINRARQYGKTTTLKALTKYLKNRYIVISLDFQKIGNEEFETAQIFSEAFAEYLLDTVRNSRHPVQGLDEAVLSELEAASHRIQQVLCKCLRKNLCCFKFFISDFLKIQ